MVTVLVEFLAQNEVADTMSRRKCASVQPVVQVYDGSVKRRCTGQRCNGNPVLSSIHLLRLPSQLVSTSTMMATSSPPSTGRALHGINFYGTPTSLLLTLSSAVECGPQSCATDTSFGSTRPSANLHALCARTELSSSPLPFTLNKISGLKH